SGYGLLRFRRFLDRSRYGLRHRLLHLCYGTLFRRSFLSRRNILSRRGVLGAAALCLLRLRRTLEYADAKRSQIDHDRVLSGVPLFLLRGLYSWIDHAGTAEPDIVAVQNFLIFSGEGNPQLE